MTTIFVNTIKNNQGGNNVRVNQLSGIDTAGSISVQGEGSATTNLQQGLAKEWNLFDQAGNVHGANTLGDSFNVSSAADVSTGHYDVSFTNNMNGTAYTPVSNVHYTGLLANDQYTRFSAPSNLTTSSYRLAAQYQNGGSEDGYFTVNTNGDLA
tara:strand:- start:299 stop:760 length:462 start_codon:yes stop_codon:yes gene_type:complete